jgi:hypothetical protein
MCASRRDGIKDRGKWQKKIPKIPPEKQRPEREHLIFKTAPIHLLAPKMSNPEPTNLLAAHLISVSKLCVM